MLPKEQLLRLSIEQEKSLLKSESKLERLKRFKSDYQRVYQQLETLPNRLEYPMMIPFGKKAFLPGKLTHTNEIFVLLGDNWFVECTAKYARQIADRRIRQVDNSIEEISKEHENISSNIKLTKEFTEGKDGKQEFEDILEFESESGEITTIKGPNLTGGVSRGKKSGKQKEKALLDFEARLAELQRAEESFDEENRMRRLEDRTQLLDDPPIAESLFENEIMKMPYTSTIQFHHTETGRENELAPDQLDSRTFSSPADIFKHSSDRMSKSEQLEEEILSKRKVCFGDNSEKVIEKDTPSLGEEDIIPKRKVSWGDNSEKVIEKATPSFGEEERQAFTKTVRERNPLSATNADKNAPQESRIISKFKLAKMK